MTGVRDGRVLGFLPRRSDAIVFAIASAIRVGAHEADLARARLIVKLYMRADWITARADLETAMRLVR